MRTGEEAAGAPSARAATQRDRPVLEVLRHAPRPVWVLIAGVFVNRVGSYFSTFVVLFLSAKGFTLGALPIMLAAIGAAGMVGSLAGGWLADTVGRKRSLVISMTASALGLVALSVASGPVPIVAAVCVVALCTQSYLPAAAALLVDHTDPVDRVPIFALFRVALNLGAALGPLIAGFVASSSYQALFLIDSTTCVLFAALLAVGLSADAPYARAAAHTRRGGRVARQVAPARTAPKGRAGPVAVLCLALFGVAMVYGQHSSTLPLSLSSNGFSAEFYGFVLAFNGLLVIIFEVPLSSLTRRWTWNHPLLVGTVLISGGMALSGLLPGALAILSAVAVWSFGEMVLTPVASTAVAELSPPDRVGRNQGFLVTAQSLGFSLGPSLGILAYARSPIAPWLACLAVGAFAAIGIQCARRAAARRTGRLTRACIRRAVGSLP